MMEIVLTDRMEAEEVRAKLAEELPSGMRILQVEDLPVKYLNGRYLVRPLSPTRRFFTRASRRVFCSPRVAGHPGWG